MGDARRVWRAVLPVLVWAPAFAALNHRAWSGVEAAEADARAGRVVESTVEIVGDPVPLRYQVRAVARVDGRHVLAVAERPVSSHLAVVEAGDRLVVRGHLAPLDDREAARFRHRHVGARLVVEDVIEVHRPESPLFTVANRLRRAVLAGTHHLPSPQRGLVAGFLVGDTRAVPDGVIDDFRAAGLSHLLAVSGANVAFVLALAGPVLARLSLRGRFAGALALVVVFAAVTRFEPSVLRASAMAALAALARLLGRPASGLRLLALAAAGLLLLDPFLLDSLGFRLSCAASAGILLLAGPITRRLRGPALLAETLAVTTAAQLGVAPVLLPAFGSVPLAALPANLLAVPLAAPLTVWGLVSGVVSGLVDGWAPELAVLAQAPTFVLARLIALVADVCGRVPWTVNPTAAWGLLSAGCAAAALRHVCAPAPGFRGLVHTHARRLAGRDDAAPRGS